MKEEKDIFCKMIDGDIPVNKIMETDDWFAIHDIHPIEPVHALVISKKHLSGLEAIDSSNTQYAGVLLKGAHEVAQKLGIAENGYRVRINKGKHGGQTIPHLHFHILGGRQISE